MTYYLSSGFYFDGADSLIQKSKKLWGRQQGEYDSGSSVGNPLSAAVVFDLKRRRNDFLFPHFICHPRDLWSFGVQCSQFIGSISRNSSTPVPSFPSVSPS